MLTTTNTASAVHDRTRFTNLITLVTFVLIFAVIPSACSRSGGSGGGGGGPAPSVIGEFLELDKPGTVRTSANPTSTARTYVLSKDEGIQYDATEGTVVLSRPARTYSIGDIIIGDGEVTRFAKRINTINTISSGVFLTVEDAPLNGFLASGSIAARITPDWRAAEIESLPGENPGKDTGLRFLADGTVVLDNTELFDLRVTASGILDRNTSHVMGRPIPPLIKNIIRRSDLTGCANGRLTARLTRGRIRAVPTGDFTWEVGSNYVAANGKVDVKVLVDFALQVTVSGRAALDLSSPLIPKLKYPVVIPTTPPVYLSVQLEVPAGFHLEVDAAGTATYACEQEYAIAANMRLDTLGKFTVSHKMEKHFPVKSVAWTGPHAHAAAELYAEPTVKVMLYEVVGPFVYLHPYIRAEMRYPWRPAEKDLYIGLTGGLGLELDLFLWKTSVKSGNLFDVQMGWDLVGLKSGNGPANNPPVAKSQAIKVPSSGALIRLEGEDPENDPLSFRVKSAPAHGSLGPLNATTGEVRYTPYPGYEGPDSFAFIVSDGKQQSPPAVVSITAVKGTLPIARFFWEGVGNAEVNFVARCTDLEDPPENLWVRWDFETDGKWDTGYYQQTKGIIHRYHKYPENGTSVVTLETRDSHGMTSRRVAVVDTEVRNAIVVNSGRLAGKDLGLFDAEFSVSPETRISGYLYIETKNINPPPTYVRVAATPSWGEPSRSYWGVLAGVKYGAAMYRIDSISLTAPTTPGNYYIIFAMAPADDDAQIMSGTLPPAHADWINGTKVALLPSQDFEIGWEQGWTPFDWWSPGRGLVRDELPLTAVKVRVKPGAYDIKASGGPETQPADSLLAPNR